MGIASNHLARDPRRAAAPIHLQRGQTVPLVAAVLLVVALVGTGLVRVASAASARAATQAAADAAALAGAGDGRTAAERLARRNGAELLTYEEIDLDVVVTVRRGRFTARARARWTAPITDWQEGGGRAPRRVP
jgi:hypothetical protein